MRKNKKIIIISLLALLISSFILLFYDLFFKVNKKSKSYEISVIASGKSNDSFAILKEGAEQAAMELNLNIRFIFLSKDKNEQEQLELIKRECENGVDAILIDPIESDAIMKAIDDARKKVKVIVIKSLAEGTSNINRVVCNEFNLGESLAKVTVENIKKKTDIMIIDSNEESSINKERLLGITNVIEETNLNYIVINSDMFTEYNEFKRVIKESNIGAVICLDRNITEIIGDYKKKINTDLASDEFLIYGVGNTYKIISLLEEEMINGTAIENEFNIGYIAVETAVVLLEGNKVNKEKEILSTLITSSDMYSKKNERILFQFIR